MRYYTAALFTILAAAATAQDISIFPECSLPCILKGIESTPCQSTDFVCICQSKDDLIKAATSCVLEACGAEVAVGQVLPATDKFCSAVGSGSGSGSSPSPSPSSSPSSRSGSSFGSGGGTTRTPTSTSKAAEPTPDEEQSTTTGPNSSFITPAPTSNSTATRPLPVNTSSVVTAGAAAIGYIGSLGMMALGALAAF